MWVGSTCLEEPLKYNRMSSVPMAFQWRMLVSHDGLNVVSGAFLPWQASTPEENSEPAILGELVRMNEFIFLLWGHKELKSTTSNQASSDLLTNKADKSLGQSEDCFVHLENKTTATSDQSLAQHHRSVMCPVTGPLWAQHYLLSDPCCLLSSFCHSCFKPSWPQGCLLHRHENCWNLTSRGYFTPWLTERSHVLSHYSLSYTVRADRYSDSTHPERPQ